jgi:hypothetical protein
MADDDGRSAETSNALLSCAAGRVRATGSEQLETEFGSAHWKAAVKAVTRDMIGQL